MPSEWKFLLLFSKRSAFFWFFFEKKNQKTFATEYDPELLAGGRHATT
jgi:hypothetical protein